MVMVPLARRPARVGLGTLRVAAEKFVPIAWAAKVVLAGSGAYLAWNYWGIRPDTYFTGDTHIIQYLQMKTGIFIIVIVLSLIHGFWLGPRMMDWLDEARSSGGPMPTGPGAAVRAVGGPHQPAAGLDRRVRSVDDAALVLQLRKKEAFTLLSRGHWSTSGKSPEFIYLAVQESFARSQRT